ncbi:type I restriction-modification system subunit M N-terminal domain-containing protein [Methylotenera sp.]|jgi:type I restriction enzyme M protein|uniref:type I restriction-modification system subunit M N-terminal domain-containing protein n=1 Tax=Methylotenera sp. TaxID=2051956 RepID=UPI0027371BAB|nr:type I restriction-modification system subunit M N-terminal domain-containing protein [Methylotenera sp.]MDP3211893.1 type I restriction-modification system subunit M N-terminal domain-containing protein [Methylotenera sp.]
MIEDIKKNLWATADKLRANMDAAEYKHIVLGLIFVKYIPTHFKRVVRSLKVSLQTLTPHTSFLMLIRA